MALRKLSAIIKERDTKIRRASQRMLMETGYDLARQFKSVVSTWQNKADFRPVLSYTPDEYEVHVLPSGKGARIFQYVDMGTGKWGKHHAPYPIPKIIIPGKMLKFQTNYSARTAPVARFNVGTGQASGAWVSKPQVIHPGIKPREFSHTFLEDLKPSLVERENQALAEALS